MAFFVLWDEANGFKHFLRLGIEGIDVREALRQAPFSSQLQHFFDDLPPDVFILVLLADDDGQLACCPQADVTTKHTPILDIKQFPVCVQIMIHPLQQWQIINEVPVIYLFAELCILIPRKCCIVGRIIRNKPDVPLHRNRTARHVHRFSVHRPHSLLCRTFFCVVYLSINHSFQKCKQSRLCVEKESRCNHSGPL